MYLNCFSNYVKNVNHFKVLSKNQFASNKLLVSLFISFTHDMNIFNHQSNFNITKNHTRHQLFLYIKGIQFHFKTTVCCSKAACVEFTEKHFNFLILMESMSALTRRRFVCLGPRKRQR